MILCNLPSDDTTERVAHKHGRPVELAQHSDNVTTVVRKPITSRRMRGPAMPAEVETNDSTALRYFLRKPLPGFATGCNAVKEYNRNGVAWALNLDMQCGGHGLN